MGDWKDALILEKDESIVNSWEGDYEEHRKVKVGIGGRRTREEKEKTKGVLVLTNRKVVFLQQRGTFSKSYHPLFTIPVESVCSISMGGTLNKYVSLFTTDDDEYIFHLSGIGDDLKLNQFRETIYKQIASRKEAIQSEKMKEKVHVMLDFSFLKEYMSKGGLNLQVIKCPHCGGSVEMPQSGDKFTCKYCNSTILAQDIFEKVKGLIG